MADAPPFSSFDPDQTAMLLSSRRTIHQFTSEPPPREHILRALDLARWAPNHRLTEPWRFYLLGPDTADAVARLNAALVTDQRGPAAGTAKLERWRTMPGWLVLTQQLAGDAIRQHEDYAACACAAHNVALYLWSVGLGVKWSTGAVTRHPRFYDLIGIDADQERVVGILWCGYPADLPPPPPRKALDEVLTELP